VVESEKSFVTPLFHCTTMSPPLVAKGKPVSTSIQREQRGGGWVTGVLHERDAQRLKAGRDREERDVVGIEDAVGDVAAGEGHGSAQLVGVDVAEELVAPHARRVVGAQEDRLDRDRSAS
jgi:hypothetical protein